jgi:hypothetical protein
MNGADMKIKEVTTYNLVASNGKRIRKATRVILENGQHVDFVDRMSKREAVQTVNSILASSMMRYRLGIKLED